MIVNGNVGVGTSNPASRLSVIGNIRPHKVKQELTGWSDFVFEPAYSLRSLSEVESFILENRHLPDNLRENEVLANGIELGAMDAKLLQKIEELTLYMITMENKGTGSVNRKAAKQGIMGFSKGIKLVNGVIICLFLVLMGSTVAAQSFPGKKIKLPALPVSGSIPKLPSKPEIPYLEELKQIQSLKKSYDSLLRELKDLREITADSTQRDSLFTLAKERSREVLEQESKTLESLIQSEDIPGEEIKNAAKNTLDRVNESKARIKDIHEVADLESLVDQNNENLKALTNEWLMPKVEEQLTGVVKEGFDSRSAQLPDFYGKDALAELTKNGLPSEIPFEQAKELAKERAGHISDEYIQKAGKDFSKLKIDSLGNIKTIPSELKNKKKEFFEPNTLKGVPVVHRIGMMLWYDPLTSFGDGLLLDYGLSYSFSQQFSLLGGVSWKKQFDDKEKLRREGVGMFTGIRFSKGNWFAQGTVNRNRVTVTNPSGYESRDFEGKAWASGFAVGRTIPMGNTIRSVVMGSVDPFFDKRSSLYKSRVQLKIGFEIGSFRKIKKEVKKLIPMDKLKDKGDEKVEYYLKDVGEL